MSYSFENPLDGLKFWDEPVFDAHIHVWSGKFYEKFVHWVESYYKKFYCLGMMTPEAKAEIPEYLWPDIIFTYYLSTKAFATYDTKTLVAEVEKTRANNFDMIKIWNAPRLVDRDETKDRREQFRVNDPRFFPVYKKIQDYGFPVIIHVSDPDIWYKTVYFDTEKYGTKDGRLQDFRDLMDKFPDITFISAHLGCLPEDLTKLAKMLDDYPQLYVDTGSTRWMCRELSKNVDESRYFFEKYKNRVLFGTDLSLRKEFADIEYYATRYWGHKVLWESDYENKPLPFPDTDTFGTTTINGLNLDHETLQRIYYKNAFELFNLK